MKKYMLIAAILALSVFNIVGFLTQPVAANLGGLKCNNLTGCGSSAQCPGKGSASGCSIFCEDHSYISCPPG
jgi:hypothetical protein